MAPQIQHINVHQASKLNCILSFSCTATLKHTDKLCCFPLQSGLLSSQIKNSDLSGRSKVFTKLGNSEDCYAK